jgi:hypothetical protein
MRPSLSLFLALAITGCATPAQAPPVTVAFGPWNASDPADKHGWNKRAVRIEGHSRPGPMGLLKVTVKF